MLKTGKEHLEGLRFWMQFRGTPLEVRIAHGELTVALPADEVSEPVRVCVGDEVRELRAGERWTCALARETAAAR